MARYTRVRGPAADFELTGAFLTIPGFTVYRSWDEGEVLILGTSKYENFSGAASTLELQPRIDGVTASAGLHQTSVPINAIVTVSFAYLITLTGGPHTFDLIARGQAAVGDILFAGATELILLQLPLWDDPINVVTL